MHITHPWIDFLCMVDSPHVDAKPVGVRNISPRAFRRRIVRYWHPLGRRAIELGKPPRGGVDLHRGGTRRFRSTVFFPVRHAFTF